MDKKFYSLTSNRGGVCLVKEYIKNSVVVTEIRIRKYPPLGEREVFRLCIRENDKLISKGVLEKDKGIFEGGFEADKLVIARKNVDTGEMVPEFFMEEKKQPPKSTENFFDKFEWSRICGFYSICKYSIIDAILAEVYGAVNKSGHYYMGIYDDENVRYIAVAVRGAKGNPFGRLCDYAYELKIRSVKYYAVCAGIDSSGEYFVIDEK